MVHVYGGPPVPPHCSSHSDDPGRRASDGILAHQLQPLVVEPTPPRHTCSLPAGRVVSGQMNLTDSRAGGFSAAYPLQVHCTGTTVVSRASAHGRSYFNVNFHRTGRLPCIKIEVGGINAFARVHACYIAYVHTFHIAHIMRSSMAQKASMERRFWTI